LAGSAGDRTERATPKRREESRKRGQVARSREVNTGLGVLATFAMLSLAGGWVLTGMVQVMSRSLGTAGQTGTITPAQGWDVLTGAGFDALRLTAPFAAAGVIVGVIASAIQVRPRITPEVLKPRFSVLNPVNGVKRLFSTRSLVSVVKDLVKVGATGAVAWFAMRSALPDLQRLMGASPGMAISVVGHVITKIGFSIGAIYIAIAAADLVYERWQHERDMRMTRDEVRREMKEQDVNPEVKGQLKRRQREMAVRRMMSAVPDADVVITNPTHFAVALRYGDDTPAPLCVAKGVDSLALKIRAVAEAAGVPVVEDPPLARALYAAVEVDQTIPRHHYEAVAKVIGFVLSAARKARARHR
jgi:flagellar biosynthesis protein FlhB